MGSDPLEEQAPERDKSPTSFSTFAGLIYGFRNLLAYVSERRLSASECGASCVPRAAGGSERRVLIAAATNSPCLRSGGECVCVRDKFE